MDKAALAEGSGNKLFLLVMPVTERESRSGKGGMPPDRAREERANQYP